LIKYVKGRLEGIPALLQSSDPENAKLAEKLGSGFINKNSETLSDELTDFIFKNLGFGDFVFRDGSGGEIGHASTMKQLKRMLRKVPDESLVYHASRNHFSAWLMARGEIQIAKKIQPVKVSDFPGARDLRTFLIDVFEKVEYQKVKGKVIEFHESLLNEDGLILRLAEGSLGGKGRGIAFVNTLIHSTDLPSALPGVNVKIPATAVIGTREFDRFMETNQLKDAVSKERNFEVLKKYFISSELSKDLIKKLKVYLKHMKAPLAVRSSGLFEDSLSESFSGVYQTYLLPNNHPDFNVRLAQLMDAVKLVYASVYSKSSRSYFEAINYKVEEERMAVVIQEVVGSLYNRICEEASGPRAGGEAIPRSNAYFYPHFSGVAQSYNYYPISHMKPSDGIAVLGVGLGKYVIDGEKSYRFCPKYPKLEISAPESQLKNLQDDFYAIDMSKQETDLIAGEDCTLIRKNISEAESDGTLEYIASVWDAQNSRINVGLETIGPRIINFARILKYDAFPLAKTLEVILELMSNAMGTPVEIEFAVDLHSAQNVPGSLYILQIKPLIRETHFEIPGEQINEISKEKLLLYTEKGMGNGILDDIRDLIYADPEIFDRSQTVEMANELEKLNDLMKRKKRKYILMAPGRWGTRDRWLGIPVVWSQITNAKIIVETGLKDFHIDASLGSHFFHNITSMNIGYFTVPYSNSNRDLRGVPRWTSGDDEAIPESSAASFIDWNYLRSQKPETKSSHFIHLHFQKSLKVLMDGKKSISVIFKDH
jgi:hypothetical protein